MDKFYNFTKNDFVINNLESDRFLKKNEPEQTITGNLTVSDNITTQNLTVIDTLTANNTVTNGDISTTDGLIEHLETMGAVPLNTKNFGDYAGYSEDGINTEYKGYAVGKGEDKLYIFTDETTHPTQDTNLNTLNKGSISIRTPISNDEGANKKYVDDGIADIRDEVDANKANIITITTAVNANKTEIIDLETSVNGKFNSSGGTMTGNLNMDNNNISNVNELTVNEGLTMGTNKQIHLSPLVNIRSDISETFTLYRGSKYLAMDSSRIYTNESMDFQNNNIDNVKIINMQNNQGKITGLAAPTENNHATNKTYVDTKLSKTSTDQIITSTNNIESNWSNSTNYSCLLTSQTASEYYKLALRNQNEGFPGNDGATMIEFQTAMALPSSGICSGRIISKSLDGSNVERSALEFYNTYEYGNNGSNGTLEKILSLSNTAQFFKPLNMNDNDITNVKTLSTKSIFVPEENMNENGLYFAGTHNDRPGNDGNYHTGIVERIFNSAENSELLLYKGNDTTDRIRLVASSIRFQAGVMTKDTLSTEYDNVMVVSGSQVDILKNLHMNGFKIENVGTPTADNDAATKKYVDDSLNSKQVKTFNATSTNQGVGFTIFSLPEPLPTATNYLITVFHNMDFTGTFSETRALNFRVLGKLANDNNTIDSTNIFYPYIKTISGTVNYVVSNYKRVITIPTNTKTIGIYIEDGYANGSKQIDAVFELEKIN